MNKKEIKEFVKDTLNSLLKEDELLKVFEKKMKIKSLEKIYEKKLEEKRKNEEAKLEEKWRLESTANISCVMEYMELPRFLRDDDKYFTDEQMIHLEDMYQDFILKMDRYLFPRETDVEMS